MEEDEGEDGEGSVYYIHNSAFSSDCDPNEPMVIIQNPFYSVPNIYAILDRFAKLKAQELEAPKKIPYISGLASAQIKLRFTTKGIQDFRPIK